MNKIIRIQIGAKSIVHSNFFYPTRINSKGLNRLALRFLIIVFCFLPFAISAKHIVGGEITYRYVSTDGINVKLAFTMKIYRDCVGGGIGFDSIAYIANFIKNGGRDGYVLNVPIKKISKVEPPTYKCLVPPNICVEEALYEWEAEFSNRNDGYVVEYQRCCRNETITNIFTPGDVGATYSIEITRESLLLNNSSPVFKTFPPIIICVDKSLEFDHSATDAEGDQIVYKFCQPLGGGGKTANTNNADCTTGAPNPPCYPPGGLQVQFKAPIYTFDSPIGGSPTVKIDRNTGLITGKPIEQGQYVVGVCAEEYRNGKLLSVMQRDFQFNVAQCKGVIEGKFPADTVIANNYFINVCGIDSFKLINLSFDKKNVTEFYFDICRDAKSCVSTQRYTDWEPVLTFPDTGIFKGKFFMNPSLNCNDTIGLSFNVSKSANANFSLKYDTCIAGAVNFTDKSFSPNGKIVQWHWDFGDSILSNQINTTHLFNTPGSKAIKLSVTDIKSCKKDTTIKFSWQPAPAIVLLDPTVSIGCTPFSVFYKNLSSPIDSTYKIKWTFTDDSISDKISPSKTFNIAGTYGATVQITSPIGCRISKDFPNITKALQGTKADFDYTPNKVNNYNNIVNFIDKSSNASVWDWYINKGTNLNPRNLNPVGYSQIQNPVITFKDTGMYAIKLTTSNTFNCKDTLVKFIDVELAASYYLPNVFTPNNDNKNDLFKGTGITENIKGFKFSIWDKWGERIYVTENLGEGWNGKKNNFGEDAPQGVYLCIVNYLTPRGEYKELKTFVTLIR